MISSIEELEIINELVAELNLNNLTDFRGGFNFSCPLCGEGSSPWKKRAYILFDDGTYGHNSFVCHNCYPDGMYFRSFVRLADNNAWKRYQEFEKSKRLDEIQKSGKIFQKKKSINKKTTAAKPRYLFKLSPRSFTSVRNVTKAVDYARSRCIPEHIIDTLYYSRPREGWAYGDMLIFPLTYKGDIVYGFQGRSIETKKFRTFTRNDSFKCFNVFGVDEKQTVYCFESIIDSFAVDNSIAMLGADLSPNVRRMFKNLVYCFDNDRTGVEKSIKYLENGEKVFLWPKEISAKDTGLLLQKGITPEQITKMINTNIYSGIEGLGRATVLLNKFKPTFRRK